MLDKFFVAKTFKEMDGDHLFLCSRLIEEGDEFYSELYENEKFKATPKWPKKDHKDFCYKKVKPISKEAIWVKDGDEFDAIELRPWNHTLGFSVPIDEMNTRIVSYVQIFNTACGHFH